jgi:hypothetical protein
MQNHTHGDEVCLGEGSLKKSPLASGDAVLNPAAAMCLFAMDSTVVNRN